MNSLTQRTLIIILSLVFLGAAIFIYTSLIEPVYSDIDALRSKEYSLDQNYNTYLDLNKKFQRLIAEYKNLGDLQNQLSIILPLKLNVDYALTQIIGLVKTSNLSLKSISLREDPSSSPKDSSQSYSLFQIKNLGVLKINVSSRGSYENFKLFIQKLESNILLSSINNFSITANPDGNMTYDMSINTYYQM